MTKAAKASGVKKVPKTPWTKKENPLLNAWAQELFFGLLTNPRSSIDRTADFYDIGPDTHLRCHDATVLLLRLLRCYNE